MRNCFSFRHRLRRFLRVAFPKRVRQMIELVRRVVRFYVDGFRGMTVGRTLWAIVLVKLFVMFAVLRLFFFPDLLAGKSREQRAAFVLEQLAGRS